MAGSDFFHRIVQSERDWRLSVERQVLSLQNMASAKRMWLASFYLQFRCLAIRRAVRAGLWIPDGLNVIMSLALKPGDIFLDIGANVGWVSERAAWLVARRGQVHSFEPSPLTIRYLQRRLICMGLTNVVYNNFALGAETGLATLYECAENYGGSSSLRQGAAPGQRVFAETSVVMRGLDDYVRQNSIRRVRLIKIDVQGAEIEVLGGAKRLLAGSNRPVLYVEVEQIANAAFGHSARDLLNVLMGFGYDLFSWRETGLVSVKSDADIPAGGHDNLICLSPYYHNTLHVKLERLSGRRKSSVARALF